MSIVIQGIIFLRLNRSFRFSAFIVLLRAFSADMCANPPTIVESAGYSHVAVSTKRYIPSQAFSRISIPHNTLRLLS